MPRHGFRLDAHDSAKLAVGMCAQQQRANDRVRPCQELLCRDKENSCCYRVGPLCVVTEKFHVATKLAFSCVTTENFLL